MARHYHQGRFVPRNPQKYAGNVSNIQYRSGWELKLMIHLDRHPSVIKWSSEETIIPYISPLDNRPHRYFVDFAVVMKTKTGEVKKMLIEVKPSAQTKPPTPPKRKTAKYLEEVKTWAVNQAKWKAAEEYAKDRGWLFEKFTERELGIK